MWVVASVCPTVGSQLGQIPCISSHFLLDYGQHTAKRRVSWNSFKTITPIFINYTSNTVKVRDIYGSFQDHLIPFKTIAFLCILVYKSNIFGSISMQPKPNKSKHAKIQIFKFHCVYCAYCAPVVSKFGRVLKTHSNHNNSNNKIGRQLKIHIRGWPL